MESIWKVLEKATGIDELHQLALDAQSELAALKDRLDELEKKMEGEGYTPKEYPKMTASGKTVWNAEEESKESGIIPVAAVPVSDGETVIEPDGEAPSDPAPEEVHD